MFRKGQSTGQNGSKASRRGRLSFGRAGVITAVGLIALGICGWLLTDDLAAFERAMIARWRSVDPGVLPPGLSEDEQLMYSLSHVDRPAAVQAVRTLKERDDERFIPVFIEMLRAAETPPYIIGAGSHEHYFAIEAISGDTFDPDARQDLSVAFTEWYATKDYSPPPGFAKWKGQMLARIDGRYADYLHSDEPARIRIEEILPSRRSRRLDAITEPPVVRPGEYGAPASHELVCGVVIDGVSRAYPQRMLEAHLVINDRVGDRSIVVTYCPAAGAIAVYDARDSLGELHQFGPSHLYYENNTLLYDEASRSLWAQLSGEAVYGPKAAEPRGLSRVPATSVAWTRWCELHPDTSVVSLDTEFSEHYTGSPPGRNAQFPAYPVTHWSDAAWPMQRIYGIELNGTCKGYLVDDLLEDRVLNDAVGSEPVVVIACAGELRAQGERRTGQSRSPRDVVYSSGAEVRVFARGPHSYEETPNLDVVLDEQSRAWRVAEDALIGPDGERRERVPGVQAFWNAWYAYNQDTQLHAPEAESTSAQ